MVAHRESAGLAEQFIHETCERQGIERGQLTIHAGPRLGDDLQIRRPLARGSRCDQDACPAARLRRQPIL